MQTSSFLGLRTTVYFVADLDAAKAWYANVLGLKPYFDTPYYVGFNVGGFELGLHPAGGERRAGPGGAVPYWGVPDLDAAWTKLLAAGARAEDEPQDVGEGIRLGIVRDPFENLLGVIQNPHFPNTA